MLRICSILYFFLIPLVLFGQHRRVEHVILISIDGFRPDFYEDANWPAPTLQYMAREGIQARGVRGVFPTVTYPSHTTLITGAKPARHGIYYNTPFEPNGQTGAWYWYEESILVPTLWDAVRSSGGTTASVFWPVSDGAPIDYNIPEIWSLEGGYETFFEFVKSRVTPADLMEEMEQKATGELTAATFNGDYLNREGRTGYMASYLFETYAPNLMTVHLIGVDHFQHAEGRDGLKVRQAVVAVDYAVNQIWEAVERAGKADVTTIVVTGDHGFVDIHARLAPNVWLVEAGLMEDAPDRGDWKATFLTTGASAFLHLKDPNDFETLEQVKKMLEALPEAKKKLFRVLDREDLDEAGSASDAALALAPIPGISMSSTTNGEDLQASGGGTHGFYPDFKEIETGFLAYGAGVKSGAVATQMGLEDIAPFVAYLLKLDFEAPDGVLYPGLVEQKN